MVQAHTTISLDADTLKKAQDSQINISQAAVSGIKHKMNVKEVIVKDKCEFCGKDEVKACKDTNYIGLTWLCPDERWICDSCLKSQMSHINIAG